MEDEAARMRDRIFALEEELRGSREREEAMEARMAAVERQLEEGRRWERTYRRREERAEAASRVWEQRVVTPLRWQAEARRR